MLFHRHSGRASIPQLLLVLTLWLASTLPAAAISLLRDADIEYGLQRLAAPVLSAAGLNPNRVRVLVVNDSSLNAFVIDTQTIYIHYGLILKVDRPEMLQAVIAHEAAHISNGHIARRMANLKSARTAAGLGIALGAAVAAAGGGEAAGGIAIGAQSSALRRFLRHTRAEESAADQSGVRFLRSAGIDPTGMLDLHRLFRGQELLSEGRQDPYVRSHPLSRDRIRAAEAFVNALPKAKYDNADAAYWLARSSGKLSAFLRAPKWTLRRAGDGPTRDITLMRQAIAYHRQSDRARALKAINGAIALRPQDPFLQDLKGQILIESRQFTAAREAYGRAVALRPNDPLILGGYGRAQLLSGQPKAAAATLEKSRARDFRDVRVLRDLGAAYAQIGRNGMAALSTAERYALRGQLDTAAIHAKRAADLLPRGSAAWQRAQDVLIAFEQQSKRRRG